MNSIRFKLEPVNAAKHDEEVSTNKLYANEETSEGNVSEEIESIDMPTGKICGKSFHSMKALSGLMRPHSIKKEGRNEASSSSQSSAGFRDLKWTRTGNGRDEVVFAANTIPLMSNGGIEITKRESMDLNPKLENTTGVEVPTQKAIESEVGGDYGKIGTSDTRGDPDLASNDATAFGNSTQKDVEIAACTNGGNVEASNAKAKVKKKIHPCSICNKSFATHHARGPQHIKPQQMQIQTRRQ